MPAMLTPYRIISPILATAMVLLPVSQAQAAAFVPAAQPAEDAPAGADAPSADAPSADAPSADAPSTDAPSTDAAGADAAGADASEGTAPVEEGAVEGEAGAPLEPMPAEPEPVAEPDPEPEPAPEIAPEPPVDSDRPKEPTVAGKPAKGKGMLIAGGVLFGAGVAGTVASILLTRCPEPANTVGCKYEPHRSFAVPVAGAGTLVGVLLLGVGLGYHVRYKKWKNWKPKSDKVIKESALIPTIYPGGAGVGYVGRF